MSIFDFFRRHSERKQRQIETEFSCRMAELTRKASAIKRQAERLKAEAVQFERAGDHKRAVSAAAAAAQQEKSYMSALQTIQTCKTMHVQVKSQKAMKELIASCAAVARSVSADANSTEYIEAQSDFARTMEELEQSREALEAAQEGFNAGTEVQVRNEAGEQALARIMEQAQPKTLPVSIEPAAALPASDQNKADEHKEWAEERRKILAEMV